MCGEKDKKARSGANLVVFFLVQNLDCNEYRSHTTMPRPKKSLTSMSNRFSMIIAVVADIYNSPNDEEQEHKPIATVAEEFGITQLKGA